MIRIPSPVEGVVIDRDPRQDAWQLTLRDATFQLRAWTWGERRRIMECATACGWFDGEVFVDALVEVLMDPRPEPADVSALACACLYLLKAGEEVPLARGEYLAVTAFGWRPTDIDGQPAAAVDRLIAQVEANASVREPADEGWTRIVFATADRDEAKPSASAETQLKVRLQRVAAVSGVPEAGPDRRKTEPASAVSPQRVQARWEQESSARREALPQPPLASETEPLPEARIAASTAEPQPRLDPPADASPDPARPVFRFRPPVRSAVAPPNARPDAGVFRGTARLHSPAVRQDATKPNGSTAKAPAGPSVTREPRAWAGVASHAVTTTSESKGGTDFPETRVSVRWPDEARDAQPNLKVLGPTGPGESFELSELEERMADVLERAVQEAGMDL